MLDKGGEGADGSWVAEDKGRRGSDEALGVLDKGSRGVDGTCRGRFSGISLPFFDGSSSLLLMVSLFLPLMEEKEAKEDQGVRDACQVCRVPEMVSIHALIPLYFCPLKSNL